MKVLLALAFGVLSTAAIAQTSDTTPPPVPRSEAGQAQVLMQGTVSATCPVAVATDQAGAYYPLFGPSCNPADKAAAQSVLSTFVPADWRTSQYLDVTSTSTPALNGRYLADDSTVARLGAIAAFVAANGRLPGGKTTLVWKDTKGNPHTFTRAQLVAFANAVSDFVYALQNGDRPSNTVTIP